MTANRSFKQRVRARSRRTGESYTAALRHFRSTQGATVTDPSTPSSPIRRAALQLAVAQTSAHHDPEDRDGFAAAGAEVRDLMQQAAEAGADMIQFPEATMCFPHKQAFSSDPDRLAVADWTRFAWDALAEQIHLVRASARRLELWTVLGAQRRPEVPGRADDGAAWSRPMSSLWVIGPAGQVAGCYDERLLSRTKRDYLYAAGEGPLLVEISGIRFGFASGLEVLFPAVFDHYEQAGADAVLFSTAGPGDPADAESLTTPAQTLARLNGFWIGYAAPNPTAPWAPAGIIDPAGRWAARCPAEDRPAITICEVGPRPETAGREWRRAMLATSVR